MVTRVHWFLLFFQIYICRSLSSLSASEFLFLSERGHELTKRCSFLLGYIGPEVEVVASPDLDDESPH